MVAFEFPHGKRFAFTIMDDTDVATVENVEPVYRLLERLGMRITKTVWPVGCPEGSKNFSISQTLEDADYREFVLDLQRRGFEIAYHGATMESSTRERTVVALERFRGEFGTHPRVYANHAYNRENLYWGAGRIDDLLLKFLYSRLTGTPANMSMLDLWSQFYVADGGQTLGKTLGWFRQAFFREVESDYGTKYEIRQRKIPQLHRILRSGAIRYEDKECQDLPDTLGGIEKPMIRMVPMSIAQGRR